MNQTYIDTARLLTQIAPLARINEAIRQAAKQLKQRGFEAYAPAADAGETKLLVRRDRIEVKVEVNFVMRGTVQLVRRASLVPTARDVLMADLDIPVVSLEDMYGGKLVPRRSDCDRLGMISARSAGILAAGGV